MRGLVIALLVVLAVAGGWYFTVTERMGQPEAVERTHEYSPDDPEAAFESCLDRVRESAKPPAMMELPSRDEVEVESLGDGRYRVAGMGDWQSEQGARMSVEFVCTMVLSQHGRWIAENVTLNER